MMIIKSNGVDKIMHIRYTMKETGNNHRDNILIEKNIIKIFKSIFEKYGIEIKDSVNVYHDYTIIFNCSVNNEDIDISYDLLDCICKSFGLKKMLTY